MKKIDRIIDITYKVMLTAVAAVALYAVLQVTTTCSFHTPSGSMTPTILPDESGLVNKWKLGARIFDIRDAIDGKPYTIRRLPGYGRLERGDVIIFNYPYPDKGGRRDSIAMNLATYYCKRAVAVAGDTLEIRDSFYRVRGCPDTLGVADEQRQLQRMMRLREQQEPDISKWRGWMRCFPKDSIFGWTIKEMGPLVIPGKGMRITLDRRNWLLYGRYVEWETGKRVEWKDSAVYIDDIPTKSYIFAENYCFAAGDHVIDSRDSRYFGLVPEKFIVGTAGIIWKPKSSDRLLKSINRH
ncbi:MAG: S26 family signal peptidase [Muribaculaceae bacterium]|nr:S26 family signal peptidase [Muribaculaceae bacterium]